MQNKVFFKLVCETVSPLEKTIEVDVNLKSLDEVYGFMSARPDLMSADKTWVIYPMPLCPSR